MKTMITRNNVPKHNGTRMCLLGRSGPWEFRAIAPRRVGPRHGDLVQGMGPFGPRHVWSEAWGIGPRHGDLVRGMFGPRHGPFWSEARSGNGPWDRLGVTVRYRWAASGHHILALPCTVIRTENAMILPYH